MQVIFHHSYSIFECLINDAHISILNLEYISSQPSFIFLLRKLLSFRFCHFISSVLIRKLICLIIQMNTSDPKFLSLRRQLDEFGYTQTLHPDCIQLVSRLLKDQMQALMEIDKRKNKEAASNQQNKTLLPLLEQQVDQLEADKKALEADKRALEKQLQEARRGSTGSIGPDQRTLRLQANVNELRVKLEEAMQQFSVQRQQLLGQIEELSLTKQQLERENQRLRSLSSSSVSKLEEENHELTLLIDRKNKDIKQLEENNSKSRIRIQVLEKTVEELRGTKDTKEEVRNDSSRITALLKQELADSEARCRQARTELEETQEELEGVRRELRRAREEIASLRLDETRTRSLDSISKAGLEKYQARLDEAASQLAANAQEIRRLKEQVADGEAVQERLQSKLKELATKGKQLGDLNADLQSQVQLVTGKLTTSIKRTRELESSNASLEKQLKEATEATQAGSAERLLGELEEERTRAEQLRRELGVREREYRLLEEEVRVLREAGETRTLERDKAQLECKKLQAILAEGSKNLQAMQLQKEELMKENRELKTGRQQIASSDQAAKSELFLARQKAQALELQAQELRAAVGGAQAMCAQLEGEVRRLQRDLQNSEIKNQEVFEDNRQMVAQLKLLQQRKKELHDKVCELQEREKLKNDTTMVARREFDQLLAENRELQAELARKDQALRVIDAERDELQEVLDAETEARARLQEQVQAVRREARRAGKEADQREYGLNDLKARLSRTESERDDLDKQLHRQVEETLQLKDQLIAAETAVRELQNEATNLTISNNQNQKQAERGRMRAAELERKLRERTKDFQEQRQRATALGILNGELHSDIERERAETARLQGFMRELQEANNSMYSHLLQKDQQLEHYAREVEQIHRQQGQYRLQIESYQRQLDNLNQDLQFARQELRQTAGDRQALRAERNWKKELAGQSEDWRGKQEQRYLQLQQEFDRKRREVEALREEVRKLEGLLGEERGKNFQLSRQLQQQSSQATPRRGLLVESRVQSYHSQNENSSNVHSRTRSQAESTHSATLQAIRRIEEQYLLTTKPNIRS